MPYYLRIGDDGAAFIAQEYDGSPEIRILMGDYKRKNNNIGTSCNVVVSRVPVVDATITWGDSCEQFLSHSMWEVFAKVEVFPGNCLKTMK